MTKTSNIIDKVENNIIHTYNRYQIALDKGEGMYLYDAEGKKYGAASRAAVHFRIPQGE